MLRFLDVPQALVATSAGNVGVPILYRKARAVMALFAAERQPLEALLHDPELELVPLAGGKPAVAVAFFAYEETSIGPYHEAAVATFVAPKALGVPARPALDMALPLRWRRVGMYILHLPVTTSIANAAGREIWGLPKFVTDIPIDWQEGHIRAAVLAPGSSAPLCTLEGELGRGRSLPLRAILLYSRLNQELIATRVDYLGLARFVRGPQLRLQVGTDTHRMARDLAALGLNGATPFLVQVLPAFQARLHFGRRLTGARPAALQPAGVSASASASTA